MLRAFYRLILRLHPEAFRREFAGEMLWIFDQSRNRAALLADGAISAKEMRGAPDRLWELDAN